MKMKILMFVLAVFMALTVSVPVSADLLPPCVGDGDGCVNGGVGCCNNYSVCWTPYGEIFGKCSVDYREQ